MGLKKDVYYAQKVCKKRSFVNYSKIYFNTNEKIDELLEKVDLKGKKVFSVLSSSDQYLKINKNGANCTDVFDRNRLTYYYYYMRIWSIIYRGSLYPLELLENKYQEIENLLSEVVVHSEEEKRAVLFWQILVKKKVDFSNMFNVLEDSYLTDNVSSFEFVDKSKVTFINVDFFKKSNFQRKYDIVFLSNILEWTNGDVRLTKKMENNLLKLLNPNGMVLCSRLNYVFKYNELDEKRVFDANFDYFDYGETVGYSYTKK